MARIRPFRALRFTPAAGDGDALLAPPTLAVSPEERARLAANPNNIVHAALPEGSPDDRSKFVRYARASAQLSAWRRGGLLVPDPHPGFYAWRGVLFALLHIEAGSTAPLRPDDPLRLLEATRTQVEPIRLSVPRIEIPEVEHGTANGPDLVAFTSAVRELALSLPTREPLLEAARAFLGNRAADPERPESYALAAFVPPGAPQPPTGLLLWSLADFTPADSALSHPGVRPVGTPTL